jgi:hypothetical protein
LVDDDIVVVGDVSVDNVGVADDDDTLVVDGIVDVGEAPTLAVVVVGPLLAVGDAIVVVVVVVVVVVAVVVTAANLHQRTVLSTSAMQRPPGSFVQNLSSRMHVTNELLQLNEQQSHHSVDPTIESINQFNQFNQSINSINQSIQSINQFNQSINRLFLTFDNVETFCARIGCWRYWSWRWCRCVCRWRTSLQITRRQLGAMN